jgi:hypothetical protein
LPMGVRIAFDGPTPYLGILRIGPFSRFHPELC